MIKLKSDEFVAVSKSLKMDQKRRCNLDILVRRVAGKKTPRLCSRNYFNYRPYLGNGCLWPKADIETESK